MESVLPAPMVIGRQRQQPRDETYDAVGDPGFIEGTMPAIRKDDEDAGEEPGSQQGERHREPPRDRHAEVHGVPENCVGSERIDQLPVGACARCALIAGNDRFPTRRHRHGCGLE